MKGDGYEFWLFNSVIIAIFLCLICGMFNICLCACVPVCAFYDSKAFKRMESKNGLRHKR